MTTKRLIYQQANGILAIIIPANQESVAQDFMHAGQPANAVMIMEMTEDQYLGWIAGKDIPESVTEFFLIDVADIPADRQKRNLWGIANGNLTAPGLASVPVQRRGRP